MTITIIIKSGEIQVIVKNKKDRQDGTEDRGNDAESSIYADGMGPLERTTLLISSHLISVMYICMYVLYVLYVMYWMDMNTSTY